MTETEQNCLTCKRCDISQSHSGARNIVVCQHDDTTSDHARIMTHQQAEKHFCENYTPVGQPDTGHLAKEQILEECRNSTPAPGKNRIGCSESWYDPFFCIQQTFTTGQLGTMTEQELNNLYRLAQNITSALY